MVVLVLLDISLHFAIALQDINMPEMDGLEATFLIRQEEKKNARIKEGSSVSTHLEKTTQQNASVPIWAISACCDDDQRQSPVLAYLASDQQRGKSAPARHYKKSFALTLRYVHLLAKP